MRGLFKKVWGGIKDNLGGMIGGALIGGPIGAIVGIVIQDLLRDHLLGADIPLSAEAEKKAEQWADKFFTPFFLNSVEWVGNDKVITNRKFVKKYNQILMQLRSWQAYYEAETHSPLSSALEKEVATAKQLILLQSVDIFKSSYEEASVSNPSDLFFENQEYDPTTITDVAGDKLDWNAIGVKTIVANNMFLTDGADTPHSSLIENTFKKVNKELPKPNPADENKQKVSKTPVKDKEETTPPGETPSSPDIHKLPNNDTVIVEEEEVQTKGSLKKLLAITAIGMITYKIIN